ncbi:iron(III) transport system permease protein [Natronocella acetinitrilica]|uniref:Iron(III) transport system permease protein n=1 Tax=Natronocella acetinitrilica TaxID=414046 RepID=A0AAE3KA97_9GAMM|nr:iron ABC transporter permease [Natronocella acetinitrilica]MCP1673146.1 iron(III) transport system permease protein [Natronocella acetinitrilica]
MAAIPVSLRRYLRQRIPLLLCVALMLGAAGYPLAILFAQSLFPNILGGRFDGFLDAYRRIVETQDLLAMIGTSLAWAGSVTLVSWIFGIPCGYLLARTDMPGKLWARLSLLVPIMTPPYILALSYILIMQQGGFGDAALGGLPEGLRAWFFSFWGVTVVMALASFGYVSLAVEATLSGLPRRLEDAASLLGAGWWTRMRTIILPLLLPAILNSGLLVFLEALSNFGVPAVLGTRSNLPLLPAEIFYLVTSWPVDLALATSLSSLLCLFALITLYGSRWLANVIGGGDVRPGAPEIIRLSARGKVLAWTWLGLLFACSSGVPYVAMVLTSLADGWGQGMPGLTLDHYRALLEPGSRGLQALLTSLGLSVAAATICVILGGYIAYVNVRSQGPMQRFLDGLATLPRVIPKIVMAVALILAWNAVWIRVDLYNTVWMLLLAYVVIYITDALNYSNSTLRSMSPNLEGAGAILGASRARVFVEIVLPRLRPALTAAWLTTFIVCMRELVASILLLPPGVDVTATFIFNQFEQGDIAVAMAMATITILLSTLVLVVFQLRRRSV